MTFDTERFLRPLRERDADTARLVAATAGARSVQLRHLRLGWVFMITPAVRSDAPAGSWQVTRFDSDVPLGHTYSPSMADAVTHVRRDYGPVEIVEVVMQNPYHAGERPKKPSKAECVKRVKTLGTWPDFFEVLVMATINGHRLPYWVLTREDGDDGVLSGALEDREQTGMLGVGLAAEGKGWRLWRPDWRVWNDEFSGGVPAHGAPWRENPDERLRDLERRAASGDPEAAAQLARALQRIEPEAVPSLTRAQMSKVRKLLAGEHVTMIDSDYDTVSDYLVAIDARIDLGTLERGTEARPRVEVWVRTPRSAKNPAPADRAQLLAELEAVQDQINTLYWTFTRTARGKPPAVVRPDLYERRKQIEKALGMKNPPRSKLCAQGRHDFDQTTAACRRKGCPATLCAQGRHDFDQTTAACRRKGCPATLTQTMFPMTQAEEEQAYGFSAERAAQGFQPGDQQGSLFNPPRPPKGTPTELNLWALRNLFRDQLEVPNTIKPTEAAGLRKCLKADLVEVAGPVLRITPAGQAAIAHIPLPTRERLSNPPAQLPEDPWRYFLPVPGVQIVPMHLIRPIRAREGGIDRAGVHMRRAYDGTGERRKPITLAPAPEGGYMVCDGNSTFANAAASGWSAIPATIEASCEVAHNPPIVDELPADGPEKQFRQGCSVVALQGLAGRGGRMTAAELASEVDGCGESAIRRALKDLKAFGYVRTWRSKDGWDTKAVQWEITEKGVEAIRWLEETKYWDFEFAGPPTAGPTAGIEYSPPAIEGETFRIEAYDPAAQRVAGQIRVARDPLEIEESRVFSGHPGTYSPVTLVRVHPDYRLQGVGTKLHELAAQSAERLWGSPLASPDDRTRGESAFWAKQSRRGKAKLGRTRKFPSASRYFLSYPPPDALNPPGWWER